MFRLKRRLFPLFAVLSALVGSALIVSPANAAVVNASYQFAGNGFGRSVYYAQSGKTLVAQVSATDAKIVLQKKTGTTWIQVSETFTNGSETKTITLPHDKTYRKAVIDQVFRFQVYGHGEDVVSARSNEQHIRVWRANTYRPSSSMRTKWANLSQTSRVIRYNPCKTITYKINASKAVGSNAKALKEARRVRKWVSYYSGLKFSYKGTTKESGKLGHYSDAAITIVWDRLPSNYAGYANSSSRSLTGASFDSLVKGKVIINPKYDKSRKNRTNILMHEILHVIGLNHVGDKKQVMDKRVSGRTSFGSGDKAGMKIVGSPAGCF